jgi:monofunctional biosynthetic peptidoglycan transglycosylase
MPYLLIPVFRFIDPPFSSLMVRQKLNGITIRKKWVDIDRISPSLVRSVILAEDASFCQHWGVDWGEVRHAIKRAKRGRTPRGASTLPMQTAKNLFLWPGQDYLRKALEVPIAYYMTLVLPKRRVAEIYLNIAEWGPGTFGIEAAARKYFRKSAANLTPMESALLAAALPNPRRRRANKPRLRHYRIASHIRRRTRKESRDVKCVFK